MELKQLLATLRHWWWLLLLGATIAGGISYILSYLAVPIYEASTTLLINQAPSSLPTPDYNALLTGERLAKTYAELLRKRPVLERVIADLKLPLDVATLGDRVRVSVVRDTQLLVVTVEDTEPVRAAAIANALVDSFSAQSRALQSSRYADSMKTLKGELDRLEASINVTQAALATLPAPTTPTTPEQANERMRLDAQLLRDRDSYTTLLNSYEAVRLAEVQSSNSINVVESAQPSAQPVSRRQLLSMALALVLGLVGALGLALLLEYLDDTVKSSDDVQALVGLPTLATVGRMRLATMGARLVTVGDRQAPVAEDYRMLRANIELVSVDDEPAKTLVVTSAGRAEGKSTTVANLAVVLAQAGKQVILVDADLRRPTLHTLFDRSNACGLTSALRRNEGEPLDAHLARTAVQGLRLMPSGPLPFDPSALLGSKRMAQLVQDLAAACDIVLFDSPPLI
ncbi:MAG: polysaccharide biosynthesis tyrosine autokinase, partial [Chloroflexales bacterium]|nr:polysaccharide biosynthesis tyrosine autokinase [Chloroflexales bacterium]